MPAISKALIRAAVLHLGAAALVGLALAAPSGLASPPVRAGLGPAQLHLLTVGWLTQLIFGVALWMFPRPRGRPRVTTDRLDWAGWTALNLGVAIRLVAEPAALTGAAALRPALLLVLSAVLQWLAVLHFAARLWSRSGSR